MTAPVQIGLSPTSSRASTAITCAVTAPVAAGQAVLVRMYDGEQPTVSTGLSVTDTQGNVYAFAGLVNQSFDNAVVFIGQITTPLTTADSITYHPNHAATAFFGIAAFACPGYSLIDAPVTATAQGISTAIAISGAAPGVQAGELNFVLFSSTGAPSVTGGWANVTGVSDLYTFWQINPAITPLAYAGTQATAAAWSAVQVALQPNSAPFVPNPRNKTMALQQRPHSIGLAPTEAQGVRITIPLILTSVLGGASQVGSAAVGDLMMEDSEGIINNIQTMFVDASAMTFPMRIYFAETQQTIFVPANTQGYYPIAVGQQGQIRATAFSHSGTDVANVTISIQFLNVPVNGHIWAAAGS